MSGKTIESCFICSEQSLRSLCYNTRFGYSTVFCCTIECCTILNSYLRAASYKNFTPSDVDKAVDHYCYSTKCAASSYNLNVSSLKRVCRYFCSVRFFGVQKDLKFIKFLFESKIDDEWSHDEPYDSDDTDFFFI